MRMNLPWSRRLDLVSDDCVLALCQVGTVHEPILFHCEGRVGQLQREAGEFCKMQTVRGTSVKFLPVQFDSSWCTVGMRRCRKPTWRQKARPPAQPWFPVMRRSRGRLWRWGRRRSCSWSQGNFRKWRGKQKHLPKFILLVLELLQRLVLILSYTCLFETGTNFWLMGYATAELRIRKVQKGLLSTGLLTKTITKVDY